MSACVCGGGVPEMVRSATQPEEVDRIGSESTVLLGVEINKQRINSQEFSLLDWWKK